MTPPLGLLRFIRAIHLWHYTSIVHRWVYRASGGKVGYSAGAIKNLLLTTTGRKSGERRTVPLAYFPDGETFVVVASNGGADRDPAWWLNLRSNPSAEVQIGDRNIAVTARLASDAEHARLWPELKRVNPFYAGYEQITDRAIPVVVLAAQGN